MVDPIIQTFILTCHTTLPFIDDILTPCETFIMFFEDDNTIILPLILFFCTYQEIKPPIHVYVTKESTGCHLNNIKHILVRLHLE